MARAMLILTVVLVGVGVTAQEPAPAQSPLAFEAASIKERTTSAGGGFAQSPDRYIRINSSLRDLVRDAYAVQPLQITGGPEWTGSTRYDVNAKASFVPTAEQMRLMLQRLLADRFDLHLSTTVQVMPVYELRMSRADSSLGPQLERTVVDCAAIRAERQRGGDGALGPSAVTPGAPPVCTSRFMGRPGASGITLRYQVSGTTSAELAAWLAPYAGRVVLDRTGLMGEWDLDLSFSPSQAPSVVSPGVGEAPTVFTAVEEQLGLKLESARGPVDVLVIESVQRPTPD